MSLSSALDTAKSSLAATQTHTALVSRNIANLNTPGATRKYANIVSGGAGGVAVSTVGQSSNSILFRNMLDSTSALRASEAVADGLDRLNDTVGDTTLGNSPAARIGKLTDALTALSNSPSNFETARAAAQAAADLVLSLNDGAQTVRTIRRDADNQILAAAGDMNDILGQIEQLNRIIVAGASSGNDVTDQIDRRDQAAAKLADYVGISVRTRANNDMVIYTDSGVTLFETSARPVSFVSSNPLAPGQSGNAFFIDGVAVTGDNSFMPLKGGGVVGLVELRDKAAVTYETQLDEIARGLVRAFAETDQTAPAGPPAPATKAGLFTSTLVSGAADLMARTNAPVPGLAATLALGDGALTSPFLIRDGGFNGVAYDSQRKGSAAVAPMSGFTARIRELSAALAQTRSFAASADAQSSGTVAAFAASSQGWLQAQRATVLSDTEYKSTLLGRTQETLSDATGVNLAEEMTLLIDLERSYQAASKLISTVDEMLAALLQSV